MPARQTIVTFGDSITACSNFREMDRWPAILERNLEKSHPGKFQVYNRGFGGYTTYDGALKLRTVIDLKPDYVFVEFGFNDAMVCEYCDKCKVSPEEYANNLEQFYKTFKKIRAKTIFVVNHVSVPNDMQKGCSGRNNYQSNMKAFNSAVKKVAGKCKSPFIDLPEEIKRRNIKAKDFVSEKDGLHLSARGCREYGEIVYEFFLKRAIR